MLLACELNQITWPAAVLGSFVAVSVAVALCVWAWSTTK